MSWLRRYTDAEEAAAVERHKLHCKMTGAVDATPEGKAYIKSVNELWKAEENNSSARDIKILRDKMWQDAHYLSGTPENKALLRYQKQTRERHHRDYRKHMIINFLCLLCFFIICYFLCFDIISWVIGR